MENWRRRIIVIVGFFEALLFSGCLFGWASLIHVLQQEGVYSHLCSQEVGLRALESFNDTSVNILSLEKERKAAIEENRIFPSKLVFGVVTSESPYPDLDIYSSTFSENEVVKQLYQDQDKIENRNSEYLNLIHNHKREIVRCSAQDKEFTLVYTVAAVMYGLTSIVIGFSLDHFGLWFTRISASVMATTGFFCLAFASEDMPWLLWPALTLIALGTNQQRLSCFQFANLYPKKRSTIILAYGAAYSISTVIFLIVQYGYEGGIPYKTIILFLCGFSMMTFPVTFLMPRMRVEDEEITEKIAKITSDQNSNHDHESVKAELSPMVGSDGYATIINPQKQINEIPLGASLWTLSSLLHFYWQFINSFLVLFYSASFNAWAKKTTTDLNEVAFYNKMMGLCQLIAPLFIPIAGFATDFLIKRASRHEDKVERLAATLEAPAYTLIFSISSAAAMLICKMFLTREAIYISLFLIAMSRPLLVGSQASYLRIRFHAEHFNRLNGIHGTLVSILCLVQYPLFVWMYSNDDNFIAAHLLLMGLLLLSFSSPGHVLFRTLSRKYATEQIAQKLARSR